MRYDVTGATDARFIDPEHDWFRVTIQGSEVKARAVPGLLIYDALAEAGIEIAPYAAPSEG